MKKCAAGCGRLGVSLKCPICGARCCKTEACFDAHIRYHLLKMGLTEQEAVDAMADPLFSAAEDRTLDRIWTQVQERRARGAN